MSSPLGGCFKKMTQGSSELAESRLLPVSFGPEHFYLSTIGACSGPQWVKEKGILPGPVLCVFASKRHWEGTECEFELKRSSVRISAVQELQLKSAGTSASPLSCPHAGLKPHQVCKPSSSRPILTKSQIQTRKFRLTLNIY